MLFRSGNYTDAIIDYDLLIRLKPDYVEAYNDRGGAKVNLGRYSEAISDFNQIIRFAPNDAESYAKIGYCLVKTDDKNKLKEAIDLIDKGLKLNPQMQWAKDIRAEAIKKMR